MEKRIFIPSFDGGAYPLVDNGVLKPNEVKYATNMEKIVLGKLHKRKAVKVWNASLNDYMTDQGWSVKKFWLWYPNNLPADIHEDYEYCVLIYHTTGTPPTAHYLELVYHNKNHWWWNQSTVVDEVGNPVEGYLGTVKSDHATVLTKADADDSFPTSDEMIGALIYNSTDGSYGVIAAHNASTITVAGLTGGTNNTWTTGDTYVVYITTDNLEGLSIGASPRVYINADRILIADYVNRAMFVEIDGDGDVFSGTLGMPAPLNKIKISALTDYNGEYFEEVSTNDYLGECGLYQYVYTAVDEDGNESNPSPVSDTFNAQLFKKDTDGTHQRWIDKIICQNLIVPEVKKPQLKKLKYFNIYRRSINYASGLTTDSFRYVERVEIKDKTLPSAMVADTLTGNTYTDTLPNDSGAYPSYENDLAPICKDICEIGNVVFAGNNKTKLKFPFNFKYYHKITIENPNSQNAVDAIIRLRICDKGYTDNPEWAIDYLDWDDFYSVSAHTFKNLEHIRLYDTDLTTPLNVIAKDYTSHYLDVFIKIPLLTANENKVIYLCFTPAASIGFYDGVSTYYNNFKNGKFFDISTESWAYQEVFGNGVRVEDNAIITSPMNERDWSQYPSINTKVPNKANANYDCNLIKAHWISTPRAILPELGKSFGDSATRIVEGTSFHPAFEEGIKYTFDDEINVPKRGYVCGFWRYDGTGYPPDFPPDYPPDVPPDFPQTDTLFNVLLANSEYAMRIRLSNTAGPGSTAWFMAENGTLIPVAYSTGSLIKHYFILFSWDLQNEKRSLFLLDTNSNTIDDAEYTIAGVNENNTLTSFSLWRTPFSWRHFDQWQFVGGKYISASLSANQRIFRNIANLMPSWEKMIGYKYATGGTCPTESESHNNYISFSETEEITTENETNTEKYTEVGGVSFPNMYLKRLPFALERHIPAPAFLKESYKNTIVAFGKNKISRFIIDGEPSSWASDTGNVIPEQSHFGLVADDSIVIVGNKIFWLSEAGIMMWSPEGMRSLTKGIFDVPLLSVDSYYGFYCALRNQYILHWGISTRATTNGSSLTGASWESLGYREGDVIKIIYSDTTTDSSIIKSISGSTITVLSAFTKNEQDVVVKNYRSYVYHIDYDIMTQFGGLDMIHAQYLSEGENETNYNIFLNNAGELKQYPDDDNYTSAKSLMVKEVEQYWANFISYEFELEGDLAKTVAVVYDPRKHADASNNRTTPSAGLNDLDNFVDVHLLYGEGNKLRIYVQDGEMLRNAYILFTERIKRNW